MMITIKQWMELVNYRITEGSDYYVNIPGLYLLESWDGNQDGTSFTIAFDPQTQKVYCVEANDIKNNRAYRLKDSSLELDKTAWDGVDYVDLESDDDFMQKGMAIKAGEPYDDRVDVSVEFTDEELLRYMKAAHELDITFNQYVERAIIESIKKYELP